MASAAGGTGSAAGEGCSTWRTDAVWAGTDGAGALFASWACWSTWRRDVRDGRPVADAAALQEHCRRTIAPYKMPRVVEFLPALPRTSTGKVQRFVLRERLTGMQLTGVGLALTASALLAAGS